MHGGNTIRRLLLSFFTFNLSINVSYSGSGNVVDSFMMLDDVKITIDRPEKIKKNKEAIIIIYALPNGNTTAQTMGKKMKEGDDWHYNIQHIQAQTTFLRNKLKHKQIVVAYLENNFKSWPLWKQRHADYTTLIPHIVDTIFNLFDLNQKVLYLNGHSGGGSFIFGYVKSLAVIPSHVKNISFLDSNYGYDSTYYQKFKNWIHSVQEARLNVFAYNDSVALYNDKPIVSATGGTWYRSKLMLKDLSRDFSFTLLRNDSVITYQETKKRITILLKTNPDRRIFHTTQVEFNGFIHSILLGTKWEEDGYIYYGARAYSEFIRD